MNWLSNTCDTIADLEHSTNLLIQPSLVSKQLAQYLHNTTLISEILWPAVFADPDSGFLRATILSPLDGTVRHKMKDG